MVGALLHGVDVFVSMPRQTFHDGRAVVESIPIRADCADGISGTYRQIPSAYLDVEVRAGLSSSSRGATSNSEREPPDPIPNSEVKTPCADGSVVFGHARVGHRQAPYPNPRWEIQRGFFFMCARWGAHDWRGKRTSSPDIPV